MPSPVLGLLIFSAVFFLIEGALNAWIASAAASVPSILGFGIGVATADFVIAILLLMAVVMYSREPSALVGMAVLLLGALSFLIGAGFVLGGIFAIVAGSLMMFWESVNENLRERLTVYPRAGAVPAGGNGHTVPARPTVPSPPSAPAGARGIVVYRACPKCGELYRPGDAFCSACKQPFG